ncbi:MAG: GNAT family N-acetyltransferase [Promethearchaeota archaeon]
MGNKEELNEADEIEAFPFIKGEYINLCPRDSKLAKTYVRWKNHPHVRKFARNVVPKTIEDQKKRFEESTRGLRDHISLDVWHKKDKKPIGEIGLGHIDWINGWANAFLQIGEKDYWNKDIGTEATKLLVEYAFNELNLNKLHGGVAVDNIGSWSVAGKIGFKLEGIKKHEMYVDGKYIDNKIYRLLKEDWMKNK